MSQIEQLYGVEVILHFPAPAEIKNPSGLIMPSKLPDWIEATIVFVGSECKKKLRQGDKVIVAKTFYQESPVIPKNQFELPDLGKGEFKVLTEHLILMKLSPDQIVPTSPTQKDKLRPIHHLSNELDDKFNAIDALNKED